MTNTKRKKEVLTMIITGLTGYGNILVQTANLVYSILNSYNKKVSILDCKSLKNVRTLKSYIQEIQKNYSDFLVLKIDSKNYDKKLLEHVQFDIILHNCETDPLHVGDIYDYNEIVKEMLPYLSREGTAILNADYILDPSYYKDIKYLIVTYGFNSKADITTSSISDTLFGREFIFYQQKRIRTTEGIYISPQEYRINIDKTNMDIYAILGAFSFVLVSGVNLNSNLFYKPVEYDFCCNWQDYVI